MAEQRAENARLQGQQEAIISQLAGDDENNNNDTGALPDVTVDDVKEQQEQQRGIVRHSRRSIYMLQTPNASPLKYAPPHVRQRTEEEQARRASHGIPDPTTPFSPHKATTTSTVTATPLDTSRNSPWDRASNALARVDKFYGDKKHDKDIDVYQFVRAVDFEMDTYMKEERRGRLDLVIKCTGGSAKMWLLNKKDEMTIVMASYGVDPVLADWDGVKVQFIESMGGPATQSMYMSRLETLKLEKGDGAEAVIKFTTQFKEFAMRAFPLSKYPDTEARSYMLGRMFSDRVSASDIYVWQDAVRTMPPPGPEKLEDWEQALSTAWSMQQKLREEKRKHGLLRDYKGGVAQSVSNMETEGDAGDDNQDDRKESAALNVAAANGTGNKMGDGQKKQTPRNKFIDKKMLAQLINAKRCLKCYKVGHFANVCTAPPANRAPTAAELN